MRTLDELSLDAWEDVARDAGARQGVRWENALRRHLQGSGSLEGARDTIYSLLSRVAELDADVADVLFASWLGAQYQGPGGALFETIEQDPFELKPREAIQFFKKRELVSPEEFAAEEDAYKSRVFGLSRVSDRYVLDRVHGSLNKALEEGGTLDEFLTEVDGYAEKLGIGGRGDYYWETVFRNNMQTALNAGRYRQQMRAVDRRPYWQYNAVMDSKTRPAHRKFNKIIRRYDDAFWATHYPPNGHRCRCGVDSLSEDEMQRDGLGVTTDGELPELMPDPGFKGSPGTRLEAEKASIRLMRQSRAKGLLTDTPTDMNRVQDATRVGKVDHALGIPRERQAELLTEAGRIKTTPTRPAPVPEGETWVEWSHPSQNDATLQQGVTRLLQDARLQKLSKSLELDTRAAAQADWRWPNPEVAWDDRLRAGRTGKWTEFQLRTRVSGGELGHLVDFWREVGQLTDDGFRNANPLKGAWDLMDLVVRGRLETLPEGTVRAWMNRRQEGNVWVEALSRNPFVGWESEKVAVNKALFEYLR